MLWMRFFRTWWWVLRFKKQFWFGEKKRNCFVVFFCFFVFSFFQTWKSLQIWKFGNTPLKVLFHHTISWIYCHLPRLTINSHHYLSNFQLIVQFFFCKPIPKFWNNLCHFPLHHCWQYCLHVIITDISSSPAPFLLDSITTKPPPENKQ